MGALLIYGQSNGKLFGAERLVKSVMYLDMSFTLKMFRERRLQQALESRTLEGYFGTVVSVHPLAGLFECGIGQFGQPVLDLVSKNHIFVEGKIGISQLLRFIPPLNLLFAQISLIRFLLKIAREKHVDLIRIGDPYYLGLLGWLLSRLLGVPLAIRVCFNYDHHYEVTGKAVFPRLFRFRWLEKRIEHFIFPRCALVAGANKNNLDYAIANGAKPECGVIFRYGNLIHPDHFVDPTARNTDRGKIRALGMTGDFLMTISRLESIKYSQHNLLVLKKLRDSGLDISLLYVGDGSLRGELERMAKELGVSGQVFFAGNQSQEWIAEVLPQASVVLSPHMGRALVEACLAGIPVVAYDLEWQSELIRDDVTGSLVSAEDWEAMARASARFLEDSAEASRLGGQARGLALEMMSPGRLTQIEIQAYEKILNEKKHQ